MALRTHHQVLQLRHKLLRVAPAVLVVLLSCSTREPSASAPSSPRPTVASSPPRKEGPKPRAKTKPKPARVINAAFGAAHRHIRESIADLKGMGFWDDLTGHLFAVQVSSRNGPENIPVDGHLADALWSAYQDPDTGHLGDLCDVYMFSQAIADDVVNQDRYYSEGRLEAPPPTLRQFWTVILGHELAHCSKRGQRGERYSTTWEVRILGRYGVDRVGSP